MKKRDWAIVFDFDGTIADTMADIAEIMNELSGEFGFEKVEEKKLKEIKGERSGAAFEKMGISGAKMPLVSKKIKFILGKRMKEIKPIRGMKETLTRLKEEGYRLGILTSALPRNVSKFLKSHCWNPFDFIYCEDNMFKKDKAMNLLLKKEKLNPEQVFYVGDETRDIEAAKKSGVKTVAVTWGFNNEKILLKEKPDFLIKKPKELLEIFLS